MRKESMGVVLFVQPYNYALFQVVRALAPILMAGNAVVLKHSSTVPRCALALEKVVADAGVPADVFRNAFISSDVAMRLLSDRRVRAGTLTGSFRAGSGFGEAAGRSTKPCVLELGGNDPYLVLADADLDLAVRTTCDSRFQNNSQSCIACKRILVDAKVAREFTDRFVAAAAALKVGDPRLEDTDIGPLASKALRDEVARQVDRSVSQGSVVALGGKVPAGEVGGPGSGGGFFYPSTVSDSHALSAMPCSMHACAPKAT
jgi:acyl-CoA reductase-like NAD-dependent aldehyde dehydrogenase